MSRTRDSTLSLARRKTVKRTTSGAPRTGDNVYSVTAKRARAESQNEGSELPSLEPERVALPTKPTHAHATERVRWMVRMVDADVELSSSNGHSLKLAVPDAIALARNILGVATTR